MSSSLATTEPVLVTGANGFLGSYIIKQLLEKGYKVRGTVRDLEKKAKYEHLLDFDQASENLEMFQCNFVDDGSFDEACQGVEVIMHVASPYALTVDDPMKDLVEPAVAGVESVYGSAKKAGSVKLIVQTSSNAAIQDEIVEDRIYTGEFWNETSSLDRNPYYYSKTLAEKKAWELSEGADWKLVSMNPYAIIGKEFGTSVNPSNKIILDLLTGDMPAVGEIQMVFVDVNEVAAAHIAAMENTDSEGRYLIVNSAIWFTDLVDMMAEMECCEGAKLPKTKLTGFFGNAAMWLGSFTLGGAGKFVRLNLGKEFKYDCSRIEKLGVKFGDIQETIKNVVVDLKEKGKWEPEEKK